MREGNRLHNGLESIPRGYQGFVELRVSNLDQSLCVHDIKHILLILFAEHVDVIDVSASKDTGGRLLGSVKVPTPQDAQLAMARLQGKKIGSKRIEVFYDPSSQRKNIDALRRMALSILNDTPKKSIPLHKFIESFQQRYHVSISHQDFEKMKDLLSVQEDGNYDRRSLCDQHKNAILQDSRRFFSSSSDSTLCSLHASSSKTTELRSEPPVKQLPFVIIALPELLKNLTTVLNSHGGSFPLAKVVDLYNAKIETHLTPEPKQGVPLEHLISCLKAFELSTNAKGTRILSIRREQKQEDVGATSSLFTTAFLEERLSDVSKKITDLLRIFPGSLLPSHKFLASYHHHNGTTIPFAEYGFIQLNELFQALPHALQIIEGESALLTLSHDSQIKRFTKDLLSILNAQNSKSISLRSFSTLLKQATGAIFVPRNYGVCNLKDILCEVRDSSIKIDLDSKEFMDSRVYICVRERTPDEIKCTQGFLQNAIELLRMSPDLALPLAAFAYAYKSHFGCPLTVSDYGFERLSDLLRAVPEGVSLSDASGDDRIIVSLVEEERLSALRDQLCGLLRISPGMTLEELALAYYATHGYPLRPRNAGANSLWGLLAMFRGSLFEERDDGNGGCRVYLTEDALRELQEKDPVIKVEQNEDVISKVGSVDPKKESIEEFASAEILNKSFRDLLSAIQHLLIENLGRIHLSELMGLYSKKHNSDLHPSVYGHNNVYSLLSSLVTESVFEEVSLMLTDGYLLASSHYSFMEGGRRDGSMGWPSLSPKSPSLTLFNIGTPCKKLEGESKDDDPIVRGLFPGSKIWGEINDDPRGWHREEEGGKMDLTDFSWLNEKNNDKNDLSKDQKGLENHQFISSLWEPQRDSHLASYPYLKGEEAGRSKSGSARQFTYGGQVLPHYYYSDQQGLLDHVGDGHLAPNNGLLQHPSSAELQYAYYGHYVQYLQQQQHFSPRYFCLPEEVMMPWSPGMWPFLHPLYHDAHSNYDATQQQQHYLDMYGREALPPGLSGLNPQDRPSALPPIPIEPPPINSAWSNQFPSWHRPHPCPSDPQGHTSFPVPHGENFGPPENSPRRRNSSSVSPNNGTRRLGPK